MIFYMLVIDSVTIIECSGNFQIFTEKHLHFTHLTPDPPFLMKTATLSYQTLQKTKTEYEIALRIKLTQKQNTFGYFLKIYSFVTNIEVTRQVKTMGPRKLIVWDTSDTFLWIFAGPLTEFISVTSLRSIWRLMTTHTERERGLVTGQGLF